MSTRFLMGAALAAFALVAGAQERFPGRPITMVVAFPPGGVADTTARPTAAAMERILGQPVTITNRPGAGGNIATEAVVLASVLILVLDYVLGSVLP